MHEALTELERTLRVKLPEQFMRHLDSVSSEAGFEDYVDSLIVNTLQHRFCMKPDDNPKWLESYAAIGPDGCGNTLFVDSATGQLNLFSHDPPGIEPAGAMDATFLGSIVPFHTSHNLMPGTYVSRHPVPWKSILLPITLDEWEEYGQHDPSVSILGYREGRNPFTDEAIRFEIPGFAIWEDGDGSRHEIRYWFGAVFTDRKSPSITQKMQQIAGRYEAHVVVVDEGELPRKR